MIESITNGCATGAEILYQAPAGTLAKLNTLTLERNAVLIARLSKDGGYDFEDMENMKRSLKEAFPNHTVLLTYDDIDFMAIEDKGCKAERIINDTSNYY